MEIKASLDIWKEENRKAIWLQLSLPSHAKLLGEALNVFIIILISICIS